MLLSHFHTFTRGVILYKLGKIVAEVKCIFAYSFFKFRKSLKNLTFGSFRTKFQEIEAKAKGRQNIWDDYKCQFRFY